MEELLKRWEEQPGWKAPPWVEALAKRDPELLEKFLDLKDCVMKGTSLPLKYKELIFLAIYSSLKIQPAADFHANAAKDAGASDEEIYETIKLGLLTSGALALATGLQSMEK